MLLAALLLVASADPSTSSLCDAAAAMTKRTGVTFVVADGVPCTSDVRVPAATLAKDEAARRFVLAVVGRGYSVVETKGKATIGPSAQPAWLQAALASCPPPTLGKLGPLVHLRHAVDAKGAVQWTKIEATGHEQTPRGKCLIERAAQQSLPAVDGQATTYSFPLGAPMRAGTMPAELKAKLDEIDREKAAGAASQPAKHDGHAH